MDKHISVDYFPDFGYKNKEKALYTIKKLKGKHIQYQVSIIFTMLSRAKNHPYQTEGMREAIKVFEKWLKDYEKKNLKKII